MSAYRPLFGTHVIEAVARGIGIGCLILLGVAALCWYLSDTYRRQPEPGWDDITRDLPPADTVEEPKAIAATYERLADEMVAAGRMSVYDESWMDPFAPAPQPTPPAIGDTVTVPARWDEDTREWSLVGEVTG